jgi:chlorite dismutase
VDAVPAHFQPDAAVWALRGVAGHARYVQAAEKVTLDAISPPLGRPEAARAALIPIRKTAAWWALSQDERRAIFEARSRHVSSTLKYLPRIARRLYHARDLGEEFDFLTWFEFASEHIAAFDELVGMLRRTEEWSFVEREVDLRLVLTV